MSRTKQLLATFSAAFLAGSAGYAMAQSGCGTKNDIALIIPDYINWHIDVDLNAVPGFDLGVQWGLPGDQFLSGEPLRNGIAPNGALYRNGYDELVVCRRPAVGDADRQLIWYVRLDTLEPGFSSPPLFAERRFGLENDRAVIGRFTGTEDTAAVIRPYPGVPNRSYFICDSNANLRFDPGTDYIWDNWPVSIGLKDAVLSGYFTKPFSNSPANLVVWRDATGVWEIYDVDVVGPFGTVPRATRTLTVQFGLPGDLATVGDFNGDGFTDLVLFRPSSSKVYINFFEPGTSMGGYGPNGDVDSTLDYRDVVRSINVSVGFPIDRQWNVGAVAMNYNHAPDKDNDGIPDCSDPDIDGDGVANGLDCSPYDPAAWRSGAFLDQDGDGARDSVIIQPVCFGALAPRGYTLNENGPDNCPTAPNPSQSDCDGDGIGDACDPVTSPQISNLPSSVAICPKGSLVLQAAIQSDAAPVIRWVHNGALLSDGRTPWGSTVSGSQTGTLRITDVTAEDSGNYACYAYNSCGTSVSNQANVRICPADFDCSGGTPDSSDINAFFAAWLAGDPSADTDSSGGTPDVSDITQFFSLWLAGC